ncbi:kinesin-like protein KIFC3 isoform X1 [Branchiostoma floridae x Branchiostoma japonicum]
MHQPVTVPGLDMSFLRQEPVFKTPMTFSPRNTGQRATPSRQELWKQELGLDALSDEDGHLSSDEEGMLAGEGGSCTLVEYQALQKELTERNQQRDDLLFKVKSLQDKNKQYKSRLGKEEENKKQQIKIMRKTHDHNLQEKQNLINNLQDVIDEQETRIFEMEAEKRGQTVTRTKKPSSGIQKLVEQINRLQVERGSLQEQLLTTQLNLEQAKLDAAEGQKFLQEKLQDQEKKRRQAENDLIRMRSEQGATDHEKQVQKLEIANERLQREVNDLRSRVHNLSLEEKSPSKVDRSELTKLETANDKLQNKILRLETELAIQAKKMAETQDHQQSGKDREIQTLERQIREKTLEINKLKAQPPQIVKQTVEVESQHSKQHLEQLNRQLRQLQAQLDTQKSENSSLQVQLGSCREAEKAAMEKLNSYEDEMEVVRSELTEEVSQLRRANQNAVQQAKKEVEVKTKTLTGKVTSMQQSLCQVRPLVSELLKDYSALKKEAHMFPMKLQASVRQVQREICKSISDISQTNQDLVRKYRHEMKLRKKYHNELVELKGNIRVLCRVRPVIREDGEGPSARQVVTFDQEDDGIVNCLHKGRWQTFELDRVFTQQSTQEEVFEEVRSLVVSCLDGYNICIFAYGQTGSGKTYTMEGPPSSRGINQRALGELFQIVEEGNKDWSYSITVNVIEIYNEMVRDLLGSDPTEKLDIKLHNEGGLHVPGLTYTQVDSLDDVNDVFQVAINNRATACTNMNEHSSRSHALLIVTVEGTNITTGAKIIGKLNLVDLAGSERVHKSQAAGDRLKEAQNINKSLSALGDVIHSLRSKQPHVPYRNSKLTYLLQESLGGDSKTLMVVQVAPVEKNVAETLASLNFAQRVRTVELGQATQKTETAEMAQLKERLGQLEQDPTSPYFQSAGRSGRTPRGTPTGTTSRLPTSKRRL